MEENLKGDNISNLMDLAEIFFTSEHRLNLAIKTYIDPSAPGINDHKADWNIQDRWDKMKQAEEKMTQLYGKIEKTEALFDKQDFEYLERLAVDLYGLKKLYLKLSENPDCKDKHFDKILLK